jgi:PAS domain S-box-containing protein
VKTDLLARLEAVLVHADEGFALTSADGVVEYMSPSMSKILGYDPEELVGRPAGVILTRPDDVEQAGPAYAALLQEPGKTHVFLSRMRCKNGEEKWIESRVTNMLEVPAVKGMAAHFRDVTDRETARRRLEDTKQRLERSEGNFRALIETTPVAVIVHRDDKILYANRAMTTLLGWDSVDELVGQPAFDIVVPEYREKARERSRSLLAAPDGTHTSLAPGAMMRRDGTASTSRSRV